MPIGWVWWRPSVERVRPEFFDYTVCFPLFAALIIQTAAQPYRLIDIQESPLLSAEQDFNYDVDLAKIIVRRHSLQGTHNQCDAMDFFEKQFAQHIQNNCESNENSDWDGKSHQCNSNRRCHVNALNWLKKFNIIRDKCQYNKIPQQRRFKMVLRKTSSENELLLMSPSSSSSNDPSVHDIPAIRRSFSSGLLF